MATIEVRTGMPEVQLSREEFAMRVRQRFSDPAFDALGAEIEKIIAAAWSGYYDYRKSPRAHPAGPGFADPDYDLSDEWRAASRAVQEAERRQKDPASPSRILLVNGAARSEHTCPGEMSKTFRLVTIAREIMQAEPGFGPDPGRQSVGARELYIGYFMPYATSHDDLDRDVAVQEDVRNAARALVQAVHQLRRGELKQPDAGLQPARPK